MELDLNQIALDSPEQQEIHSVLQRIATGPELSKDISLAEARSVTANILNGKIDPVRSALFFIALRMKRETDEENRGILSAIKDSTQPIVCEADEVIDIAEAYSGYNRTLTASPFLPALLAALGLNAVSHGVITCSPKFGVTHKQILDAAGINTDMSLKDAAVKAAATGWAYVDQSQFCPALYKLLDFRKLVIKRLPLTTVETVIGPIRGRQKTHLVTGYVHTPYPPVYASLARHSGFGSALIVRGVEGGIIPSLRQKAGFFHYHAEGKLESTEYEPQILGIEQTKRAVNLPDESWSVPENSKEIAEKSAELGLDALKGAKGITYDALVYAAALILWHVKKYDSITIAADEVRKVLDSGKAAEFFWQK